MTPKEQYEARKKERNERTYGSKTSAEEGAEFFDLVDRIATALERIADSLEPINIEHKPYDRLKEKTNEPI